MATGNKLGQEPAYPTQYDKRDSTGRTTKGTKFGVTKRLYIACMAMQGLMANPNYNSKFKKEIARMAFAQADEMLLQEVETNK